MRDTAWLKSVNDGQKQPIQRDGMNGCSPLRVASSMSVQLGAGFCVFMVHRICTRRKESEKSTSQDDLPFRAVIEAG